MITFLKNLTYCSISLNRRKYRLFGGFFKKLILIAIYSHVVVNLLITGCFLKVSHSNYPGGEAMIKLHELEAKINREYFLFK